MIWRLITRREQALFNLEIKKKRRSSIDLDIHHFKVFSSVLLSFKNGEWWLNFFFKEEEEGERVNDPKWKDVIEFNNSVIELSSLNGSNSDPPAEKPDSDPQSRVYISASEKSQLESTNFEISQIDCSESGGGEVFSASDQLLMLDSFQETYRYIYLKGTAPLFNSPRYPLKLYLMFKREDIGFFLAREMFNSSNSFFASNASEMRESLL